MELKRLHGCETCIYVLIPGLLAMSMVLSGLFLWGLVKKHKKSKEMAASTSSRVEKASVFPSPPPPPPEITFLPPEPWNAHVNDSSFDPQSHYAQVLYEAQKYEAQIKVTPQTDTLSLPANARLTRNYSFKQGRQIMTLDNHHNVEKSKSSWKFWQRSKKYGDAGYNISPPTLNKSLKRSMSGPVAVAVASHSATRKAKGNGYSGPLYSVGMSVEPAHKFGKNGTRSGSVTPNRSGHLESPYKLLKSTARQAYEPEPLYTA